MVSSHTCIQSPMESHNADILEQYQVQRQLAVVMSMRNIRHLHGDDDTFSIGPAAKPITNALPLNAMHFNESRNVIRHQSQE